MKKLDKIILALFSILIFLESILVISVVAGWIKLSTLNVFASQALEDINISKVVLGTSIVCS